jgi:hypothetical protein
VRLFTATSRREKNLLASDHVYIALLELTIPGAPTTFRLANWVEDVNFHGFLFNPFPMNVDSVEDTTSSSLTHLRVSPQNVTQEMIALFEFYWLDNPDWTAQFWQVDAMMPNETPYTAGSTYNVMSAPTDFFTGMLDLVAEGYTLTTLLPRRRFTAAGGYPHIPRR